LPNAFGLSDMHGNVWEWSTDNWHNNYKNAPVNGSDWMDFDYGSSKIHILRGGSWMNNPLRCRSASRDRDDTDVRLNVCGFRVVSTLLDFAK
jgi:formylglycine-generating enzyme required for sulfatase activity